MSVPPDMCDCAERGYYFTIGSALVYFDEIRNNIIKSWNTTN